MNRILSAGTKLANLAYNLAQSHALPADVRAALDATRKEWDAAVRAAPVVVGAQATPESADIESAKSARLLDMAFRDGVKAGWNAAVTEDNEKLAALTSRVGTRAEYAAAFAVATPASPAEPMSACWCATCRPVTLLDSRMVLCSTCGNKRCPRANDHRHDCSGSNEPGQSGSAYPAAATNQETPP